MVNYTDLLCATARLLRRHADVRRQLQQKYQWAFVDEFQDTDPIQAEILVLLAADETLIPDREDLDWTALAGAPGAPHRGEPFVRAFCNRLESF